MFWVTFNKLQLSPDPLRPYDGCLFGFVGDQVEVRGHVELRTTFSYGTSFRTINIRYLAFNVVSAYNILLSRPSLNMLDDVASKRHMKMKLSSLEGRVIVINSDQKATRKCYENSLKNNRGVCVVAAQAQGPDETTRAEVASERRPEPIGEVQEKDIKGKKLKLGSSLGQKMQDQIVEVIARHLNTFAWTASDMPDIDPDFLCHKLTMDEKVRPIIQRRRKFNEETRKF